MCVNLTCVCLEPIRCQGTLIEVRRKLRVHLLMTTNHHVADCFTQTWDRDTFEVHHVLSNLHQGDGAYIFNKLFGIYLKVWSVSNSIVGRMQLFRPLLKYCVKTSDSFLMWVCTIPVHCERGGKTRSKFFCLLEGNKLRFMRCYLEILCWHAGGIVLVSLSLKEKKEKEQYSHIHTSFWIP